MTPTESDIKERIAAKLAVTMYRASLDSAIEAEDWATAGDVTAFLRCKIRQLELLDIQRKQEAESVPPTQSWVDQFSNKIGGLGP